MSEMIERVAKAICHYQMGPSDYNSCCSGPIKECQHKARVAIEAMREPTEAMIGAVDLSVPTEGMITDIWGAMIEAALK